MINLLDIWKNHNIYNDSKYQNTFIFTKNPECIFVKGNNLSKINTFEEMDTLELSEEEQKIADEERKKFILSGDYDGNLFFIKKLIYNPYSNQLYIELIRTKYSVIKSLSYNKREELNLYKTSILSATITNDNKIFFFERSRDKFYSTVAGFLETKNIKDKIGDFIFNMTENENREEIYGEGFILNPDWIYNLTGISYSKSRGYIEFITNIKNKNISSDNFINIFKASTAVDRKEHTNQYFSISINNNDDIKNILNSTKSGKFLYMPVIISNLEVARHQNLIIEAEKFLDKRVNVFTNLTDTQFKFKVPKFALSKKFTKKEDNKASKSYNLSKYI